MKSAEQANLDELVARAHRLVNLMSPAELRRMLDDQTKERESERPYHGPIPQRDVKPKEALESGSKPLDNGDFHLTCRDFNDFVRRPPHWPSRPFMPKPIRQPSVQMTETTEHTDDYVRRPEQTYSPFTTPETSLKDTVCELEWYKPMTVGDLQANLTLFDPTARVIGPQGTSSVRAIKQTDGDILIAEMVDTKTIKDCASKFPNEQNFRGFPEYASAEPLPNECITAVDIQRVMKKPATDNRITISVYVDDGNVREYTVNSHASAREHVSQIINTGYRYVEGDKLTHIPPHRIHKVVAQGPGISTSYPDSMRGT